MTLMHVCNAQPSSRVALVRVSETHWRRHPVWRSRTTFAVTALVLCACEGSKTSGGADAQVSGSMQGGASGAFAAGGQSGSGAAPIAAGGTPGPSNGGTGNADGGCTPAPESSTPRVLSGEVAEITSRCGKSGSPPPRIGPVPATQQLQLAVAVLSPKADELDMFAMEVSDPNSPLYRHFLTPEQLTALFGPSICNYQAVVDWLKALGIQVTMTYPDRFLVDVLGTVAQIEVAFHVTLNEYQRPDGTTFYGPDRDPSVTVGASIEIDGLDNCFVPTPGAADSNRDAGARN